jgi:hypothetical protein
VLLGACGGGDDEAAALRRAQQAAATPLALQDLAQLHRCLGELSRQLQQAATPDQLNLACLAGTYKGLTGSGDECALRVDALRRRFSFFYGSHDAVIDWAEVAVDARGRPVHNLEPGDADERRPGVQLSRFTAVPQALTETLVLQAGLPQAGLQGLPHIHYMKVEAGRVETLSCNFGA